MIVRFLRLVAMLASAGLVACVPAWSRDEHEQGHRPPAPSAADARLSAADARPSARENPKPEPAYGSADLDPSNDEVVGPPEPIPDCAARLERAGVSWKPAELPLQQKVGGTYTCGAAEAVVYLRGPEKIRFNGAPVLTCGMALALARFERLLNEEASRVLGSRVVRIEHIGTYNCRKMTRFRQMVSEHSYGNAIDIRRFTLENGRSLAVLPDFGPIDREPARQAGVFLRGVARRSYDEGVFSVVCTPFFDSLHRDHFHFDLARYRVDGTR